MDITKTALIIREKLIKSGNQDIIYKDVLKFLSQDCLMCKKGYVKKLCKTTCMTCINIQPINICNMCGHCG